MNNFIFRLAGTVVAVVLPLMSGCSSETTGPNRPPVAIAGEDRVVELGESVTLSGVDSYDPDGSQLTSYTWTLVASPEGATAALSGSSGMTTELIPDVAGVWLVRLVVSDGELDSEPDVVQVRAGGCECTSDADCDDGAYCTGVERCVDCTCISEDVPDCSDGDVCTQDVCNEDLDRCENPPVTEPPGSEGPVGDATCSDGVDNDCDGMTDGADTACIVCTTDAECDDQNECTDDSCSGGSCVNAPVNDGTACDDGLWCTDDGSGGGDVCQNGRCVGQQERDCSGVGDQCNGFTCDELTDACVAVPVDDGTACDDGLWCTENDECADGVCGGTQRDCSGSAGECEVGVCNDDLDQCEVQPVADGGPCDDGSYCTVGETCLSGSCQGGGPRDCTAVADECNDEACDDTADACVPIPRADGTECGTRSCDLLEWTRQTCVAGACTGSDTVQNCDDGRECTTDACDPAAGCSHVALSDGTECGTRYCDGLEHKRQTCLSGVCSGSETLADCDDTNECTTDTCDGATGCGNANVADGTECGARYCSSLQWRMETCVSGQCTGNALQQNCDDTNVCTDDACDPAAGCSNTNNTDNCDDGNACTMNDVCANGSCAGVPLDGDGDGHVDENCPSGDDCDDSRANVYPGFFEGSFGDAVCSDGLDNDCDGLTDSADDTCQQCTTDDDCDNNDVCDGVETCVGVACQPGTPLTCNDGVYCNGLETCDPVSGCQTATNPCPETECNHCNETAGNCFDQAGTACTDDGDYCTGVEECNGAGACVSSGNPCEPETECNECNGVDHNCFNPVGTACTDDGDYCTGVEECNGAGACISSGNPCLPETECNHCNEATDSCFDPAGTGCSDDGEYCTGVEECDGAGTCISLGNPCPETECNHCNEGDGNCYDSAGTSCGSSSNTACTDPDTCDGSGTCQPNHEPEGTSCNDGTYCNGTDECNDSGVCSVNSGDPCLGGSECNAHCNETGMNCYDPVGTSCGDGADTDCTDPDTCDGSGTCQPNHEPEGTGCNDGLYCTATDACNDSGVCQGSGDPCGAGETCVEETDSCVTCFDNSDCPPCMWCVAGSCENQAAGNDIKGDCPLVECYTGDCDGFGSCEPEGAGTSCGDGNDSDCDHPDECDGAGTCDPNYEDSGIGCDDGLYCTATDTCDGAGTCEGTGDPCLPTESCDETGDTCVQVVCTADTDCPPGDICWPSCSPRANGCVTPPGSLTLVCEDPVGLPTPAASNCTITLAGGDNTGQADCLTCTAEVGVTTVDVTDFSNAAGNCDLDGWTLISGNNCTDHADNCTLSGGDRNCCSDFLGHICADTAFSPTVVRANDSGCDEQVRMTKTFDLSGLTDLWICFDIADNQATGNESIQLYVDGLNNPTAGTWEQIFCLDGDNLQGDVDDFFYNYCATLPSWTEDQADTILTFVLHSNDDNDIMYLDNIVLRGWGGGCAPDMVTVLDEDFNTPGECDTTGWSFSNGDWICPGLDCSNESGWSPGIEADRDSFDMETVVDASELDGEVTVCFQLGYKDTTTSDWLTLEFDAGSGWTEAWQQAGRMGPNSQCRLICKNLSDIDPAVNNNSSLGIRFQFDSSDGEIVVYGVTVTGARYCTAGPAVVALSSPPSDDGGGNYGFTATDTYGEQLDADITCHWDPDAGFSDVFTVHYREGAGFKRRRLTFGNGSRGSNLLDFPVLVVLDSAWFDYTQTQDAGEDLRFFDDDGSTPLPYEIEEWNESGTSYVWVKVPQIDASSDTDFIWMHYGDPAAEDDQDPPGVWTAGYVAVWHLDETGSTYSDSTGNGNDGSQSGNSSAGGIISGAQYFDGDNDHIVVPNTGLQITGDEITIEAWARPTGEPVTYCHVVGAGSDGRYWQIWWDSGYNGWHGRLRVNGNQGGMYTYDGDYNDWNYVAILYDGSERRLYWDAAEIASEVVSGNLDAINTQFWIGENPGLSSREFQGYIDEVRISNVYRTDDWLDAQHDSMRDLLITFGSEEDL